MIEVNGTLLLQFVNFMILMAVLNVLLFKPLRAALQARKETIEGSQAKVRDIDEQVQAQIARYEAQLQDVRLQGGQERATLRKAAQEEESRILGAASQKSAETLQSLKVQIQQEANEARKILRSETDALAKEIAGKVLGRAV